MEVGTNIVPTTTAPPTATAEHISSFLLHIHRRASDDAAATAVSAAEALATPPSPDVNVDATEGATANAASATDDATMPTASDAATLAGSPPLIWLWAPPTAPRRPPLPTPTLVCVMPQAPSASIGVAVHAAVGATAQSAPTRRRKQKYAPMKSERRHQRREDRRDLDDATRERLTAVVHSRAEMRGEECECSCLRTAALFPTALHRLCLLAVCGASGNGGSEAANSNA